MCLSRTLTATGMRFVRCIRFTVPSNRFIAPLRSRNCFAVSQTRRQQKALLGTLAGAGSESSYLMPTPRQVQSIATLHSVRKGRKVHHVLLASGGVAVDARQTLVSKIVDYPSLSSMTKPATEPAESHPELVVGRWFAVATFAERGSPNEETVSLRLCVAGLSHRLCPLVTIRAGK